MTEAAGNAVCCPPVDPALWDGKEFVWDRKLFIKDSVRQLFHMPLPGEVRRAITRMWERAQRADAAPEHEKAVVLAYDPSPWKSELFLTVTKEVPDAENIQLSGTFLTRVFDGPYNAVPKWIREMDGHLSVRGRSAQRYYFFFTSCPKCARKYGHNYVVLFAQVI